MTNDGLSKWQRYRLKDLDAYRKKKSEYARTPEQRKIRTDYMRKWREKNRARHNELCLLSHHRNKHKHVHANRDRWLKGQYGIGTEDKNAMVVAQSSKCKICAKPFSSSRNVHVDHDHKTNRIRGLLCMACNTKLGWFESNRDTILAYL